MFLLLIMALLWGTPDWRVDPAALAAVEGAITTDGGAPLAGVKIAIDGLAKPIHWETVSNPQGQYAIANIMPGSYTVSAEAKGFGCVIIPRLVLEGGKKSRQDFQFLRGRKKLGCPTAAAAPFEMPLGLRQVGPAFVRLAPIRSMQARTAGRGIERL
jgi:hypothetical protein